MGLNLNVFDKIYFIILKKHVELFAVDELLRLQLKKYNLRNANIVVLDEPTNSQTESLYQAIIKEKINGGVYIKDADGFYNARIIRGNSIAIYPLEKMTIVNPQHKSYVSVDDMYYITNVIENKIIGHFFNAGGSCFNDVNVFCSIYNRLKKISPKVYVSHIIYQMLLNGNKFRPTEVCDYIDWGDEELMRYYRLNK